MRTEKEYRDLWIAALKCEQFWIKKLLECLEKNPTYRLLGHNTDELNEASAIVRAFARHYLRKMCIGEIDDPKPSRRLKNE